MKHTIKVTKEVDIKILSVSAGARYWEDSQVDGIEDTEGKLIPCRKGDMWCPEIDIETGKILNWKQGVKADIHYKVCDNGIYILKDEEGNEILKKDGYVPGTMSPKESGFGDYIIMNVDENGLIEDWSFNIEDFEEYQD